MVAMKTRLFLLIICAQQLFVTFSSCQDDQQVKMNSQVRKLKKMHLMNPRKFLKVKSNDPYNWKKRVERKEEYTVFPVITDKKNPGVPDSPFFPQERAIEQKRRVKKVLPDYFFQINRRKRSVKNTEKKLSSKFTMEKKTAINSSKLKSKANVTVNAKRKQSNKKFAGTSPSPKLKYTKKNKKRILRKLKRVRKSQRRGQKIQKRHQKTDKNLRKKLKRQEKRDSRRLIAGKDATIGDYPYVVSIQKGGEHWCAGALLNPRLVITTANCVWKSDRLSRLKVRAGSRHTNRGGQVARVQEVMKHPKWSIRGKPDYDVALLLLDRNIKFSDTVHGVDLPNHFMMPVFEDAWVTSWGSERRDGIYADTHTTLQVYHQRLMDHEKCNNVTKRFGVIVSENFICLTQTGRRAPCTRDTGAPAVSDGVLWGLASWGIRKLCGTERFPSMFSYLASHSNMDFITNATHYLMSEQRHYPFLDRFPIIRADKTKPV